MEPDPTNAALARLNTQTWEDRCEVIEAAVWTHDGEVSFSSREGDEAGAKVITGNGTVCVRALTLNTLLGMTGPPDFVKDGHRRGRARRPYQSR